MRPEAVAYFFGVLTMLFAWILALCIARLIRPERGRKIPAANQYHTAQAEVDSILDLLKEKFGDGWVNQSLAEFSLAATVERAIRWSRHNDEQNERMAVELKQRRAYEEYLQAAIRNLEAVPLSFGDWWNKVDDTEDSE